MMRVAPEIVPHVFEDRRFRNLFEIEQHWHPIAASEDHHEWRIIGEELMFGIEPDAPPSARPYYGTVGTTQGPASRYGLTMFVLRDSVRQRATVTFGCTYVLGMGWAYAPSPLTAPTERSLWLAEPTKALFGGEWFVHPDPLRVPEDTVALARGGTPVAQIFGGVSLDDVETIIFPEPPDKALQEYADSLGVPWQVEGGN